MLSSASSLPTWHVSCIPQRVLVDKLESGFLLFETQQGLMRVDPSFGQRVRLLWTFRNFRQLSVPLLNPRERALVNQLFWRNVGFVPHIDELTPIIGVVEKFTPPPIPREILDGDLIVAQILPTEPKKPKRQKVRRQDRKPVISFDLRRHLVSYRSVLSSDGKDLTASWSKRFTNVAANIRSL